MHNRHRQTVKSGSTNQGNVALRSQKHGIAKIKSKPNPKLNLNQDPNNIKTTTKNKKTQPKTITKTKIEL